jgi:hypothetical protein
MIFAFPARMPGNVFALQIPFSRRVILAGLSARFLHGSRTEFDANGSAQL